jgi:hypothetical protein
MPTIVREDGFVVRVYGPPREHPPPHVHVEHGDDALVVIRLAIGNRTPLVWAAYNMRDADVLRAFRLVEKHHALLLTAWRRIHEQVQTE